MFWVFYPPPPPPPPTPHPLKDNSIALLFPGPPAARDSNDSRVLQFAQIFFDSLGDRKTAQKILKEQAPILHEQADLAARSLEIFRSGAVIVDEVDLILHPLKRYCPVVSWQRAACHSQLRVFGFSTFLQTNRLWTELQSSATSGTNILSRRFSSVFPSLPQ